MTTAAQMVRQVNQKVKQGGGIISIRNGLAQIAKLSKIQVQANKSALEPQLKNLTGTVLAQIRNNEQNIGDGSQIKGLLRTIASNLPTGTMRQLGGQFNRIDRQIDQSVIKNRNEQVKQNQIAQLQNSIFQAAVQNDSQLVMRPSFKQELAPQIQRQQPIQRQVSEYKGLLASGVNLQMVKQTQVPKSIVFLQKYAALQNKIPIGRVSGSDGVAFVGVQKVKTPDGRQLLFKFEKNIVRQTLIPNIPMQLRYHSNRTINTWNNFVEQQSKLVKFINKVSTQKNRQQYTSELFNKLNLYTFASQALATLVFYYVYLPLQRFIKQSIQSFDYTYQSFVKLYSVGIKSNPLFLTTQQAKSVVAALFVSTKPQTDKLAKIKKGETNIVSPKIPTQILNLISTQLKEIKTKAGQTERLKFNTYFEQKQSQARLFFTNSGIGLTVQDSLFANKDWSSVKRRNFFFPGNDQNNQYANMCKHIIQKTTDNKQEDWDLTWQSNSIPAFDYIFDQKYLYY